MDWLARTFLEDPTYPCALLGLSAVVLMATWWRRRQGKWLAWSGAAVGLICGLVALERLVVTDRERIALALAAIASAVEAGDVDRAAAHVDDDFGGWKQSKALLVAFAREQLSRQPVSKVSIVGSGEVEVLKGRAYSRLSTVLHLARGEQVYRTVPIRWTLEWVRRPEGWRVRRAESSAEPPT